MRELKIAVWHNLPSGGGKRALYYHIKGLLEKGHTVEAWCPPTADQAYLPLNKIIKENIIPLPLKQQPAQNPLSRLTWSYHRVMEKSKAMNWHCEKCAEQINKKDYDLLFANSCMFFGASPIGRFVTIPKIIYLGEPFRNLYEAMPELPWIALPEFKTYWWMAQNIRKGLRDYFFVKGLRLQAREEVINAKAFDLILVNSLFSRENILRVYGLESKVCYLGIDTALFRNTEVSREKFVVGLGGIIPFKRLDRAIRAIATIDEKVRPDLVWIGNMCVEGYKKEMEELARSLGVNLISKLRLSDIEVVEWLNRAGIMLYTSQLEPFGFAPLEANACGVPVVAIAEGGVRESLKDGITGFFIDGDNPVAIGDAILRFLKEPDLARKMGEGARKYVCDNWNWGSAIDRLENYFQNLVSSKVAFG